MFNFILTTEDSLKIIGYAWLPMVVWPLLTAQTIEHFQHVIWVTQSFYSPTRPPYW